jgi:hypothetical protein
MQQVALLLDHFVGTGEQRRGHLQSNRLRGRHVDDQFEARRLQDREVGGFFPFENPAGIDTNLATRIGKVSSIAHQPADFDVVTLRICSGNRIAPRKCRKLDTPISEEPVGDDKKRIEPLAHNGCECRIDLADGAGVERGFATRGRVLLLQRLSHLTRYG